MKQYFSNMQQGQSFKLVGGKRQNELMLSHPIITIRD